jgi:hypothetical protein
LDWVWSIGQVEPVGSVGLIGPVGSIGSVGSFGLVGSIGLIGLVGSTGSIELIGPARSGPKQLISGLGEYNQGKTTNWAKVPSPLATQAPRRTPKATKQAPGVA